MTQLTDAELDAITSAAWPLHPAQRAAFQQMGLGEWHKLPPDVRGPGSLHRIIAAAQKDARGGAIIVSTGNLSHYDRPQALRDKGK